MREYLYKPLLRCRTADGRRPHIFFDVEGIGIGDNFIDTLVKAIEVSRKFVPVYSVYYFNKSMCRWELSQAFRRDPMGVEGILSPILKDAKAAGQVPPEVSLINYRTITSPDWFTRLCQALELKQVHEQLTIRFLDKPPTRLIVNHTLPSIQVALTGEGRPVDQDGQITLRATGGSLQGSLTQPIKEGIATFDDLSFSDPAHEARLIAESDGCEAAYSRTIEVEMPPGGIDEIETKSIVHIAEEDAGKILAVFFAEGRALAVISPRQATVYVVEQANLVQKCKLDMQGQVRLWRCEGQMIALLDWTGTAYALWEDGRHASWNLAENLTSNAAGFTVPGDIAFVGDTLYVGMWTGVVYRLEYGKMPDPILRNNAGVQALAYMGERLYVCGFDGTLDVYECKYNERNAHEQARRVNGSSLKSPIHMLCACGKVLVAAGEQKLYQIQPRPFGILSDTQPLSRVLAVFGDVPCPVIISTEGKGISFDDQLTIRANFSTVPGAIPVSVDNADIWRVFYNPDRSFSLMQKNRIVYCNQSGLLAVNQTGELFAIGDAKSIRLLTKTQMRSLF